MMPKPASIPVFYPGDNVPDFEVKWINDSAKRKPEAEAIAKPLRDKQLVELTISYQERSNGKIRAGVTGVRQSVAGDDYLIQLPFDAWSVGDNDFLRTRMMQLSRTRKLSSKPIGSLTDRKRRVDVKAHERMSFDLIEHVGDEHLQEFMEYTQGHDFLPWLRDRKALLVFSKPIDLLDHAKRLVDRVLKISESGGFRIRKSFDFDFIAANDDEAEDKSGAA